MRKITVDAKELAVIKDDLENTLETWDSLLNALEACMLKEDWQLVHAITIPTEKSIKRIKRILR